MSEYERRNFVHLIIPPSWRKEIQSRKMNEEIKSCHKCGETEEVDSLDVGECMRRAEND